MHFRAPLFHDNCAAALSQVPQYRFLPVRLPACKIFPLYFRIRFIIMDPSRTVICLILSASVFLIPLILPAFLANETSLDNLFPCQIYRSTKALQSQNCPLFFLISMNGSIDDRQQHKKACKVNPNIPVCCFCQWFPQSGKPDICER